MRSDASPLDARAFGLAAAAAAAVLSAVCAAAIAIAPGGTMTLFGYLFHSDLGSLVPTVTWGSFIIGVVGWALLTGITFFGAAVLYNRLAGAEAGGAERSARGFA